MDSTDSIERDANSIIDSIINSIVDSDVAAIAEMNRNIVNIDHYKASDDESNVNESIAHASDDESNANECNTKASDDESNINECNTKASDDESNINECIAHASDDESNINECIAHASDNESNVNECSNQASDDESNINKCSGNASDDESNINECSTKASDDEYNINESSGDDESNINESSAKASDDESNLVVEDEEDNDDDAYYTNVNNDMMLFFKSIEENEKSNESNIDDSSNDNCDICNDRCFNNDDACQERHYFTTQRDNLYKILSVPSIDNSSDCIACKNRNPFPEFITISSPRNALDIVTDPPSLDEYINEPRYPVSRHYHKNLSLKVDKIVPEDHVLSLDACDGQNDNSPILYEDPYEYERYREEFKDSKEQPPHRNDKIVESMRAQDYFENRNPDNDLVLCVLQTFHICLCFLSSLVSVVELYLIKNSKEMVGAKSLSLIFTNDAASKVLAYYIILISTMDALFLCRELKLKIGFQTRLQVSASFLNRLTFVQDFLRRNSLYYRFFLMILLLGVGGSIGPLLSTVVGCSSAVIYLFDD